MTGIGRPTTRLGRGDHLPVAEPAADAEVADEGATGGPRVAGGGRLEREQVRVGEVRDVDVVADARAVGRRVVVAEQRERAASLGRAKDVRDEVRLRIVVLAECARSRRRR